MALQKEKDRQRDKEIKMVFEFDAVVFTIQKSE